MQGEQTKQQTKQQTITKQNQQQNTDVLKKTAPAVVQEKNEDAELDKILRRPRSKKKLKLYAEVDLPSMADEEIMERMRKERASGAVSGTSWGDGSWGDDAGGEGAGDDIGTEDISKEDIAAYLQSRQEEFIKMVQGEIKEEEEKAAEEERKRREEEESKRRAEEERERQRRAEEERKREEERKLAELAKKKLGVLCKCSISGCYVHFIPNRTGWAGVQHYSRRGVPKQFKAALNLYETRKGCCVEIYDDRLVVVAGNGEVLKIEKTEETEET